MKVVNYVILPLLFLLAVIPVFSEDNLGDLEGFVHDKDGKTPLSQVLVILRNVKTKKEYKVLTGEMGEYRFSNLPDNVYVVELLVGEKLYQVQDPLLISPNDTKVTSFALTDAVEKKKGKKKFLKTPLGIAVATAGTASTGYLGYELLREEEERSATIK